MHERIQSGLWNEGPHSDTAIAELRQGVALEDALVYMEPPEWIQPSRHTLGAILLAAGRFAEAEQVYRTDLARWRGNGWSLYGLSRALEGQDRSQEAAEVAAQHQRAWARADAPTQTSCMCIPIT